ncbi:hypothetical protein GGTG_04542 [Gaeumannomyces tritici R3-111a-1]|uniref:SnoaL-like domain-containing protein n=1 Tax=Gaeumannomyces tritici (strain R3-111a-1) TaxID=644352 RepID=J3NTE3_GAET3|nr:hypothetical protein GGTG_04542 [Gaeumannomyces tritici R3-111a-1]EJT79458.1 hypothetical protein GGTG_04542 [Gaeumannomyces tritici R3-111a-1]
MATSEEVAQLRQTVEALQKEVTRLNDQEEIRKLQYTYGYYLDKCLYEEVVELFSDSPDTYAQFLGGRFNGKAGVRRLYVGRFARLFVGGRNGPVHGFLLDHPQLQAIVSVDYTQQPPRAKCRARSMMQAGVHVSQAGIHPRGVTQWWEGGVYENEYIRDGPGGTWRILRLRYNPFWHGDVEHGWAYKVAGFVPFLSTKYPEDPSGPDEVTPEEQRMLWPDTRVVPFHYRHPITGEAVKEEDLRAPVYGTDVKLAKPALNLE